jgi:hypothetical protein
MYRIIRLMGLVALLLYSAAAPAKADLFSVTLNTSALSGTQLLAFGLTDGDGSIDNTVSLTSFRFGSGSPTGAADYLGTTGASGNLTSGVALDDSGGLALFSQAFNPDGYLSFILNTTNNFAGTTPDGLAMYVCPNDGSFACYSNDTATGALLILPLAGGTLSPASFTLNGADLAGLPAPIVSPVTTTPEPASMLLLAIGLLFAGLAQRRPFGSASNQLALKH